MTYEAFLNRIIDDGIKAAKQDYARPDQASTLEGSIAGFEACRGLYPHQLRELLEDMLDSDHAAAIEGIRGADYWRLVGIHCEVEWVCNCVSAALVGSGLDPIVPITVRGMMKAAEVLGVKENA